MGAQAGRSLILERGVGAPLVYTRVAGMETLSVNIDNQAVDVTTMDSNGWQEMLGNIKKSVNITGNAIAKDGPQERLMLADLLAGTLVQYRVTIPDVGTLTGTWLLTPREYSGGTANALTFGLNLQSSGEIVYVAAT